MKAVAVGRRRFGDRRVHVMLERQGWQMNQKTLPRLYREVKLQVRKCGGRKWKEDDNRYSPHSSLGNFTPQEFALKTRLETKAA